MNAFSVSNLEALMPKSAQREVPLTLSGKSRVYRLREANVVSRYRQSNLRNPEMYCVRIGNLERALTHHGSAVDMRALEIGDTTNITSI
jgi:hypothetical protein